MEKIINKAIELWGFFAPVLLKTIPEIVNLITAYWWLILLYIIVMFIKRLARPHYGIKCTTNKGEKVKSHGEKQVADLLNQHGIDYEYEKPLVVGWWIFKWVVAHPDFYLPKYDLYIEYWGLVDTDSNYKRIMKFKMRQYHLYGVKFVSIYPDNLHNLEYSLFRKIEVAVAK